MDVVLEIADEYLLDSVYSSTSLARDDILRQVLSLLVIVNVGAVIIYLLPASLSYHFLFDKRHLNHPQILKVSYR